MISEGRPLFAVLWLLPAFVAACSLSKDQPKTLQERATESDAVIAGYTRGVFRRELSGTNYSAEFLVFVVLKGQDKLSQLFERRKPSALESLLGRRLLNVTGFGGQNTCKSDVNTGETYLLFLDVLENGRLVTKYDGASGVVELYSREKEEALLEALGGRAWGDWSPCSGSCGGGLQQRRRRCDNTAVEPCSEEDGQQRACNTFTCIESVDVLAEVGLRQSRMHPADRPSGYRLLPKAPWRSDMVALPRAFPWEFSLLLALRTKSPPAPGFLLRVLHSGAVQVGVYFGESISLALSATDSVRVTFDQSLSEEQWHQVAFSVRRNTASLFVNCRLAGKLPLPGKVRPFGGKTATLAVGSLGNQDPYSFQGDVEQLVISADPDAAAEQCNTSTQPLVSRGQHVAARGSAPRPLNDARAPRGDIAIVDEDFSFEDDGSGLDHDEPDIDDDEEDDNSIEFVSMTENKGIPIRSESEDDEEDEEDYEGEEKIFNYEDDEQPLDEAERFEGSGLSPHVENKSGSYKKDYKFAWSEWSPCSASCNWGRRSRSSFCLDNGADLEGCAKATDKAKETEACFLGLCPTTIAPPIKFNQTGSKKNNMCRVICKNGGTCNPPNECTCLPGFHGSECQHGCGQACSRGGQCNWSSGCRCPPGYIPPSCTALCKPSCRNGGVCVAPNKCRCAHGYIGRSCEKAVCRQGCKNGGRCVAPDKCACPSGYGNKDCGSPLCDPICHNGGYCVKPYSCHCPPSTEGAFCEKFVCQPECRNGGTCTGPGKCTCAMGYGGEHCEQVYCSGGCKNGGKCGKTGKCICPPGYLGLHCEARKCRFVAVKEPYKRGYKQKITSEEKVPCGAWGWKECTKTKVHYAMVYKTFYRTTYRCDSVAKPLKDYHHKASRYYG